MERFRQAADILGISAAELEQIASAAGPAEAIEEWKDVFPSIKSKWKALVFECHPDRSGDRDRYDAIQDAWSIAQRPVFARVIWALLNHPKESHPLTKMNWAQDKQSRVFTSERASATTRSEIYPGFISGVLGFIRRY